MKRIFPLIVVLITLSVVGILFIQMSWINNALKLKNEEFLRGVDNAMIETKKALQDKFVSKNGADFFNEESRQFFLQNNFRIDGVLTRDEVQQVIEQQLRQNNIKEPFEFCITNIFKLAILQSDGFQMSSLNMAKSIEVAPDNAVRSHETLYLSIFEDKNAIIPVDAAIQSNLKETVTRVLASLTPREERVLRMRFGIGMNTDHTLEEVGQQFSVTRERIRQIEAKALRKLKHPSRSRKMRSFLDQ